MVELRDSLELLGHEVIFFGVNKNGEVEIPELIGQILEAEGNGRQVYLNFTYVNNESGVIWPLELAQKIKEETKAIIHVDAVQSVAKMPNWNQLLEKLDAYTFSGHKFGAMKGVGFSFFKKNIPMLSLLNGGNQQNGLRSGTENSQGIYSLKLALEDIFETFNAAETFAAKAFIEKKIVELLGNKGEVVAAKSHLRNNNTVFIIIYGQKSDALSARFDMQGVEISTGSACSSGAIKDNRVLLGMGYSSNDSRSILRFSFSPLLTVEEANEYGLKIEHILKSILKC